MSEQTLRKALEKLRDEWLDCSKPEVENLADLLAAHPAEPAPEVVVGHRPGETCSIAAEVDPETGFAQPLLDREVTAIYRDHYQQHGPSILADLVMELARPMPTREQIAALLLYEEGSEWAEGTNRHYELADAVLALINGGSE
jgi:hypothetical protein